MRRSALLVSVLVLAACGSSGEEEAAEPPAPPPATTQPAEPTAPTTTLGRASCDEETFPSQGQDHVDVLPAGFAYNSFPATSGPHNASVVWNAYSDPLPQLNLVHNLEHGGIVAQFGSEVPQADLQALAEWYVADPVGLVLAPLPDLGGTIALTAWTHLLTCTGFDEDAATAFRDEYRFNGPELIPPQNLQPGT